MKAKALRVLEFSKILKKLEGFALSTLGKKMTQSLFPSSLINEVKEWQQETLEAEGIVFFTGKNPMSEFQDIRNSTKKSKIGAILSPKELLDIAHYLTVSRKVKKQIPDNTDQYKRICLLSSRLLILKDFEEEIFHCILGEDEISDSASSELSNIRRQIRRSNEKIKEKLNSIIHSSINQKYLQETIITMRGDRYVVPVKQEYRSSIPGLIHDQSSSGATLFIEPLSVVESNNDLKQWMIRERVEIEHILQTFTSKVGEYADDMESNLDLLVKLDFIFAKGCLSQHMKAVSPKLNDKGYINMIKGRHPLISEDCVVPIDIWLGKDFTSLVVTGPNTGGKTVTLKTLGLLTLMAQAGLHVPANEETEIAVFENIFADIGDEQSIEQSLSTFSSHMTNIVEILNEMSFSSLVLFDELGAGTDPTEGAALAMAILDELSTMHIRTVATTHYSELKAYALTHLGVENASVEFDTVTLKPTYRLSIGIPGKSNAFEISKRIGLSDTVILKAREYLTHESIRFEDVISNAENQRQIAEKERNIAEVTRREVQSLREALEIQKNQFEVQKTKILYDAKQEAKRLLIQSKEEAENIIKELRKKAEDQSYELHMKEIQDKRDQLNHKIDEYEKDLNFGNHKVERLTKPPHNLKPGDAIKILSLDQKGTVLTKPDSKGELQIQVGILKFNTHISDLRIIDEPISQVFEQQQREIKLRNLSISLELDVRGQTLDEAIMNLDKYLDDVFLSGIFEVSIIHGKGTGVLRQGIHQHLRNHPHVNRYRIGKFGEGEHGVTIIEIK